MEKMRALGSGGGGGFRRRPQVMPAGTRAQSLRGEVSEAVVCSSAPEKPICQGRWGACWCPAVWLSGKVVPRMEAGELIL